MPRHREGLKRVGDLAILSHDDTKAKDETRRSLWEPSSNTKQRRNDDRTHAGIAPNALNSLISIAICKPRVSPSVKPPRRLRFPAARCRHGGRTRRVSTNIPPSWPFFTVPQGWPSCIAWFSGSTWCVPKWGPVAFAWCVCCLQLTGLDRFVGASYGTQQQVNRQVEEAIVAYRREESARVGQGHARQRHHLGQG